MRGAGIRIGTSGWHYPAAGGWNGLFYPKPRPRGFDELAFYARFFDTVEINTTFYGQPRAEVSRAWADRTPEGFQFSVKLYQQFTHPKMFLERVTRDLARRLGTADIPAEAVAALIDANASDIDEFKRGIAPLAEARKLGPLLAQFPASFKDDASARTHLAALLRAFGEYSVAVELRHRSWSDHRTKTLDLLEAFGAGWVQIDEPKFADSVRQDLAPTDAPFFYLRLHGRNAKQWWHHAHRDDRYDYLYDDDELQPMADALEVAAKHGKKAYAYANNHKNAQAIVNATELKEMVGQPVGHDLPAPVAAVRTREASP
jgi:uncharacterized protein YecE (DUF72 family)